MKRAIRLAAVVALALASACVDSTIVLQVTPEGKGRGILTTRIYMSGVRAFDSLFPWGGPQSEKTPEQELTPPDEGDLSRQVGAKVRLVSTKFDKAPDGGVRTTVFDFDDVTALKMQFPPVFAMPGGAYLGINGLRDAPIISFSMKPHDNGDRLLLVKLPDSRVDPDPDPEMTVFKTDSPEELAFKRAIKQMALRFYVELDGAALLRTNSPVMKGNRATILDLDLDKIINNLDESKVRRALSMLMPRAIGSP